MGIIFQLALCGRWFSDDLTSENAIYADNCFAIVFLIIYAFGISYDVYLAHHYGDISNHKLESSALCALESGVISDFSSPVQQNVLQNFANLNTTSN